MERELTMDLPSLGLVFIVILVKELVAEKEVKTSLNPLSGSPPGHVPQVQRQRGVLHTPAAGGLLNAVLSVESGAYCARAPEVLLYLRSRFTSRSPHLSIMMAWMRRPCFALNTGESVETRLDVRLGVRLDVRGKAWIDKLSRYLPR